MDIRQSTEHVYDIRRLYEAGAVDRTAALLRLSALHEDTSQHAGVRRLCVRVAETIGGVSLALVRPDTTSVAAFTAPHSLQHSLQQQGETTT